MTDWEGLFVVRNKPAQTTDGQAFDLVVGLDVDDTLTQSRVHSNEFWNELLSITNPLGFAPQLVTNAHTIELPLAERLSLEHLMEEAARSSGGLLSPEQVLTAVHAYFRLIRSENVTPVHGVKKDLARLRQLFPNAALVGITLCPDWWGPIRLGTLLRHLDGLVTTRIEPVNREGHPYPNCWDATRQWVSRLHRRTNREHLRLEFSVLPRLAKPNPAALQRIQQWAGLPPERCLLVDDNAMTGGRAAITAGWRFVFARYGARIRDPQPGWPALEPGQVIDEFAALLPIIARMYGRQ